MEVSQEESNELNNDQQDEFNNVANDGSLEESPNEPNDDPQENSNNGPNNDSQEESYDELDIEDVVAAEQNINNDQNDDEIVVPVEESSDGQINDFESETLRKPRIGRQTQDANPDLFLYGDEELSWVEAECIQRIKMMRDYSTYQLLTLRMVRVCSQPCALEMVQSVHRVSDRALVLSQKKIYQRHREEAKSRIKKELTEDLSKEKESGVWLELPDTSGNKGSLVGTITGPEGTPYEGGRWKVELIIPSLYPFRAPCCKFLTRIWHPNVDHRTGEVCLLEMSASLHFIKLLLHFQGLLSCPDLEDPVDSIVAAQARDQPEMFYDTARHWTSVYASLTSPLQGAEEKVNRLVAEVGGSHQEARDSLSRVNWDIDRLLGPPTTRHHLGTSRELLHIGKEEKEEDKEPRL